MKNFSKNIFIWIIISLILVALFNVFDNTSSGKTGNVIAYSDFVKRINSGEIKEVKIDDDKISGVQVMVSHFILSTKKYRTC